VNDSASEVSPVEPTEPEEVGPCAPTDDLVQPDGKGPSDDDMMVAELLDDMVDGSDDSGDPLESQDQEGAAETFLADLQRVTADFANFRRQTEKRHADLVKQAGSRLAMQLLPVLDAFDAAVAHGSEDVEPIRSQLLLVLEREGLEHIGDPSEPFDPNRHEAAMHEPAEEGQQEPVVAEVLRTGYAWNGRVLRPAMVKVRG